MQKLFCLVIALFTLQSLVAQKKKVVVKEDNKDSIILSNTKYRLIGPWRGGRSAAVAGSYTDRQTFYFGGTGGGVWKTTDGGNQWKNISDKYFGGTIGAVAVAPSDEQVIYVGEGENTMRGNVSEGIHGVWKTDDGGRTWKNIGLKDGRHIIRLIIHPRNPDIVWAAVVGHLFGPNTERGIFKTTDGGKNWKKVLYVNEQTGASDLVMEPGNPNILYAGTWRVIRTPYSLESGGEGSGIWKSMDGGETWKNISANKGFPKGTWGIVGVAVAPSNPDKVYAIVENEKGGLFSSNNAGDSWTLVSSDNNIRQRAWYYTKVYVDPKDEHLVYAPNVEFMRSRDGGKTFQSVNTPHSDHHDLWIDPKDGQRMIIADDGGAQVSFNGGEQWSTYMNQPTAQLYRLSADNAFPYRVLAAQQDNSTLRIRSRTYGGSITEEDWEPTAGFESGYVVADPLNPDIVYGGNYGGYLSRYDHKTRENRAISVWPDNPIGSGADVLRYRFQWNFPIFFSPHNPRRLYAGGNVLFVSENEGQSWQAISPDLTTNDKSKQVSSGGPITQDNTSVEYYCTIFTAAESPLEKDLLWVGTDDGLIQLSRNGGSSWENVTPRDCPKWMMWNRVEVDPFKKGAAYFVGTRYKLDDFTPYIYKTEDYGKSWKLITRGIPSLHFTRALVADKKIPGLLYAGTEYGMYISYDDGNTWKSFQLNLPVTPITDLLIKNNDLVVATQGRSIYILDDLTIVQHNDRSVTGKALHVFPVNETYRMQGYVSPNPLHAGMNPPNGVVLNYFIRKATDSAKASIEFFDSGRRSIRQFSTNSKENKLEINAGMNQFVWNLLYPPAEKIDGMILWNGVPDGLKVIPGNYTARIKVENDSIDVPFVVKADPNYKMSQQDYADQFNFLEQARNTFNEVQKAIKDIRSYRAQINGFIEKQGKDVPKELKSMADSINAHLTAIEEQFYQTKAKSSQDILNYPIRLNDKISGVYNTANSGYMAPSKQVKDVYAELKKQADTQLNNLKTIKEKELPALNKLIRDKGLEFIK